MTCVDGVVLAVPNANKEAYLKMAEEVALAFRRNGALSVMENWGVNVPDGQLTSLPMAVQCKPDETVVFSWVVWPSREARDKGMEKTMSEMSAPGEMPFDGQRMIFGTFETILDM